MPWWLISGFLALVQHRVARAGTGRGGLGPARHLLMIIGMTGMYLNRIDHCACGTPYQKPQIWLTTTPEVYHEGAVCTHPNNARPGNPIWGLEGPFNGPIPGGHV